MELIEQQQYNACYKFIGEKLLDSLEKNPNNKPLRQILDALEFVGIHNNHLMAELRSKEREIQELKQINENVKVLLK